MTTTVTNPLPRPACNHLAGFIAAQCEVVPAEAETPLAAVYAAYQQWMAGSHPTCHVVSAATFTTLLKQRTMLVVNKTFSNPDVARVWRKAVVAAMNAKHEPTPFCTDCGAGTLLDEIEHRADWGFAPTAADATELRQFSAEVLGGACNIMEYVPEGHGFDSEYVGWKQGNPLRGCWYKLISEIWIEIELA